MSTVLPLAASHVAATAALLARAMDDDPAYRFLFPDEAVRTRGLADYFARSLRTHLPYACTYVLLERNAVTATVTVRPPEGFHVSTLTMIRRGLLPFALAHGGSSVRRLFALKDAYDGLEVDLSGGRPHRLVHMMAVDPSSQGQGHGSSLLESVLSMTSANCPALLTTHKERNVTFYLRAGFAVVRERELALPKAAPYPVWGMEKPARSLSGASGDGVIESAVTRIIR
jgi:GNAT superfamily N-acetyltransferase